MHRAGTKGKGVKTRDENDGFEVCTWIHPQKSHDKSLPSHLDETRNIVGIVVVKGLTWVFVF